MQDLGPRPVASSRQQLGRGRGHVLELEGDDIDRAREARQGVAIVIGGGRRGGGDLKAGESASGQ